MPTADLNTLCPLYEEKKKKIKRPDVIVHISPSFKMIFIEFY